MLPSTTLPSAAEIVRRFPALERHAERLILPLSAMCENYLHKIANPRQRATMEAVFARLDLPALEQRYTAIQAEHLTERNFQAFEELIQLGKNVSAEFKYLDFPFWFAGKWQTATSMNLKHLESGGRVFDIGSGPGHFATVCNLMGIEYLGVDAPLDAYKKSTRQHIYDDLRDLLPYARETEFIKPETDMTGYGLFDLVTCQMGIFCSHHLPEGGRRGWSLEEWKNFLPRLMENTVKPGGEVYLQLSRDFVHGEIAEYLAAQSWQARLDTNVFRIRR